MDALKTAVKQLTANEFSEFFSWLTVDERDRRQAIPHQTELITQLRESGDLEAPAAVTVAQTADIAPDEIPEWVDTGTNHARMYTQGNVVRHKGRIWESIIDLLNSWEPGNDNGLTWRDITDRFEADYDPNAPKPFVHPTGAHDAYGDGDRVIFNGKIYYSTISGNAYSPDEYPAGWILEE